MSHMHTTISGHEISLDLTQAQERFLSEVVTAAASETAIVDHVTALVYGERNPLLGRNAVGAPVVTAQTLASPLYRVLLDLIDRKRLTSAQIARVSQRYTHTVAEAAEILHVVPSAIRQAIAANRIPSWMRDGKHYLDPSTLSALRVGQRGPTSVEPLTYTAGYDGAERSFLQIKTATGILPAAATGDFDGTIQRWRRVAVLMGGHGKARLFVIEPSSEANEIAFHGFLVKGMFSIVEKVNSAKRAREAWESFTAA